MGPGCWSELQRWEAGEGACRDWRWEGWGFPICCPGVARAERVNLTSNPPHCAGQSSRDWQRHLFMFKRNMIYIFLCFLNTQCLISHRNKWECYFKTGRVLTETWFLPRAPRTAQQGSWCNSEYIFVHPSMLMRSSSSIHLSGCCRSSLSLLPLLQVNTTLKSFYKQMLIHTWRGLGICFINFRID